MKPYLILEQDDEGSILAVTVQELFPGGPPVGATIPADERNSDWRRFQAWRAEGNAPDPMEG